MAKAGIYLIFCKPTGEKYVGSANDLARRFKEHRYDLRHGLHDNHKLTAEWLHHTENGFEFSVLEHVDDLTQLLAREQYWIDTLKPTLNIAPFAIHPGLGVKRTQATKDKMSVALKKSHDKRSPERNEKVRQHVKDGVREWWDSLTEDEKISARKRRSHGQTDEVRKILSEKSKANHARPMLGKTHSPETRAKLKVAADIRWADAKVEKARKRVEWELGRAEREAARIEKVRIANTGKKRTLEQKEHLRQVALAQQQDPEYRAKHAEALNAVMSTPEMREKLSKAHKGKTLSAEHRANIGKAGTGKKRSEESKKRLSEARRKWWAERKAKQEK